MDYGACPKKYASVEHSYLTKMIEYDGPIIIQSVQVLMDWTSRPLE